MSLKDELTSVEREWGRRLSAVPHAGCLEADALIELSERGRRCSDYTARMEHIALCPSCRALLLELRATGRSSAPLLTGGRLSWRWALWIPAAVALAGIALAAGLFLLHRIRPRQTPPPVPRVVVSMPNEAASRAVPSQGKVHLHVPPASDRPVPAKSDVGIPESSHAAVPLSKRSSQKPVSPRVPLTTPSNGSFDKPLQVVPGIQSHGSNIYENGEEIPHNYMTRPQFDQEVREMETKAVPRGGSGRPVLIGTLLEPDPGNYGLTDPRPVFKIRIENATAKYQATLVSSQEGSDQKWPVTFQISDRTLIIKPIGALMPGSRYTLSVVLKSEEGMGEDITTNFEFYLLNVKVRQEVQWALNHERKAPLCSSLLLRRAGMYAEALRAVEEAPAKERPAVWLATLMARIEARKENPSRP